MIAEFNATVKMATIESADRLPLPAWPLECADCHMLFAMPAEFQQQARNLIDGGQERLKL